MYAGMSSLFRQAFACCLRPSDDDSSTLDEHTHLIPPGTGGPPPIIFTNSAIDNQKTKDRLTVIVRAKEGKMVNVLSAVPFNLRNDSLSPHVRGSSSRSDRGSPVQHTYSTPTHHHLGAGDRRPSHQASLATSRSTSTTSLVPNSASETSQGLGLHESEPILNLRLVRPSVAQNALEGRGRPRARSGKGVEVVSLDQDVAPDIEDLTADHDIQVAHVNGGVDGSDAFEDNFAAGLDGMEDIATSLSPPKSFTIEDVGNISRGWGD